MCRVLSYLGQPISVVELLYKPDNSFIKQSYHPQYMSHLLNLAGFGLVAWDKKSHYPTLPYIYKTPMLPFYDDNLRNLASKITPDCMLAHIRGVSYLDKQVVALQNVHPFIYEQSSLALAHNGALMEFEKMKYQLLEYIHPEYVTDIHGTTDSEWIYAVFLSQLPKREGSHTVDEIMNAILETLKIIQHVRHKKNITLNSPVNLFITNGQFIAVTRFVFDYGWQPLSSNTSSHFTYHSLWYTYGECYGYYDNEYKMKESKRKSSIIISSEPLTSDPSTWISVPEYTMLVAHLEGDEIKITSQDINI
jgi:glutamine amidotransferase